MLGGVFILAPSGGVNNKIPLTSVIEVSGYGIDFSIRKLKIVRSKFREWSRVLGMPRRSRRSGENQLLPTFP